MASNAPGAVSPASGNNGDHPISSNRTKGAKRLGTETDIYVLLYEPRCVRFHSSACLFTALSVENSSDASLSIELAASLASAQSL